MRIKDIIEVLINYDCVRMTFPQNEVSVRSSKSAIGYCDHESHTIYIDKNVSVQRLREIVIHELIHASLHMQGKVDDEKTVEAKGNSLYKRIYANTKNT
jgi:Zn-dependent peptidase ImmA (M78 family)